MYLFSKHVQRKNKTKVNAGQCETTFFCINRHTSVVGYHGQKKKKSNLPRWCDNNNPKPGLWEHQNRASNFCCRIGRSMAEYVQTFSPNHLLQTHFKMVCFIHLGSEMWSSPSLNNGSQYACLKLSMCVHGGLRSYHKCLEFCDPCSHSICIF